ncbi:hypothetical protein WT55_19595 [Burkholderia pseudomultivorans]|nr:hypothetical protein WT55_19595 [Burkholderia pseudomultivorans]
MSSLVKFLFLLLALRMTFHDLYSLRVQDRLLLGIFGVVPALIAVSDQDVRISSKHMKFSRMTPDGNFRKTPYDW